MSKLSISDALKVTARTPGFRVTPAESMDDSAQVDLLAKNRLAKLVAAQKVDANVVSDQKPTPVTQSPGPMSSEVAHVQPVTGRQQSSQAKKPSRKYLDEL